MDKVFMGYASQPETRRQTLAAAARKLSSLDLYEVMPWENLRVGGRVIVNQIIAEIQASTMSIFDVSALNANVLFEVGFAIGSEKRIWLLRDRTDSRAEEAWKQLRTLTTIGYSEYVNSEDIKAGFMRENPAQAEGTVFGDSIQNALLPAEQSSVLYLPSAHETDAGRSLSRTVLRETENRGIRVVLTDPEEAVRYTLPWYAQQVYSSVAVIAHFCADWRKGAATYNPRISLVAGLALGWEDKTSLHARGRGLR